MVDSQVKIDEIDVKILKTLLKDARTSFADIARNCGISTNAIVKRFYKLKQSGVITGATIRINMNDLGYHFRLSIDINVENGDESHILETCKKISNSVVCYNVVGKYDIHAVVYIKTLEQNEQIRHYIKKLKGVKRVGLTATYESRFFPENLLIQPTEAS
jgi:Lrp/AsnC family transcriptional regulator for asnA, asnC and gidA